ETGFNYIGGIRVSCSVVSPINPSGWASNGQIIAEKSIVHGRVTSQTRPNLNYSIMQYNISLAKPFQFKGGMNRIIHNVSHKIIRATKARLGTEPNINISESVFINPTIRKTKIRFNTVISSAIDIVIMNIYTLLVNGMGIFHGRNRIPESSYLIVRYHIPRAGHFNPFSYVFSVATHRCIGPLRNASDNVVTDITIGGTGFIGYHTIDSRSEEHTSELQSRENLVCR